MSRICSPLQSVACSKSCQIEAQASKGYGFVKYQHVQQAVDAIQAFNGFNWNSYQLEVKFADQDAGPPLSGAFHTLVAVICSQHGNCSHFLQRLTAANLIQAVELHQVTICMSG